MCTYYACFRICNSALLTVYVSAINVLIRMAAPHWHWHICASTHAISTHDLYLHHPKMSLAPCVCCTQIFAIRRMKYVFIPLSLEFVLSMAFAKTKNNCKKSIAKISLFKLINLEQFRNTNQKLHNFNWIRSGIFRAIFRSKWRIVFWSVYLKIHNWRIIQNDWSNERKWNGWTYGQSFRKGKTF